MLSNLDTLPLF